MHFTCIVALDGSPCQRPSGWIERAMLTPPQRHVLICRCAPGPRTSHPQISRMSPPPCHPLPPWAWLPLPPPITITHIPCTPARGGKSPEGRWHKTNHILTPHASHITHHTSHITHRTSHLTHHTSHTTHHTLDTFPRNSCPPTPPTAARPGPRLCGFIHSLGSPPTPLALHIA
jgi:hypothetical protein